MKTIALLAAITFCSITNVISQEYQKDNRPQSEREDGPNWYNVDQVSRLDILEALEMEGIRIHKFKLGSFDKKYHLNVMVDEYKEGEIVSTDTILMEDNTYRYFPDDTDAYFAYLDQIKIFSKLDADQEILTLKFSTYKITFYHEIDFKVSEEDQFYNIRQYENTEWVLNKKIPLLILASSWKDEKYGFQRFCGAVELNKDDKDTEELLTKSPHYFEVYYEAREIKEDT